MSRDVFKINKTGHLGKILLDLQLITPEKLEIALKEQSAQDKAFPRHIGETLVSLGFLSEDDMLRALSTQFGLKSLRLARELEPGFVITVEPGIYFIAQLMDLWRSKNHCTDFIDFDELDKWRDFGGVRNEEDFLITETGYRLLGKPIPKTIEDVEAMKR